MWWILQIIGSVGVAFAQACNRHYGMGMRSWIIYSLIAMFVTYPTFGKSFVIAPSFFSAWFVGLSALNVFGILTALFFFKDCISIQQWVGCAFSIIGGFLLVK